MQDLNSVISFWHQLIEDFDTSALDFYESVEGVIKRRQIPNEEAFRTEYKEGGLLSADREYLRIIRGAYSFDICAAPFGTGYFFSWWLTVLPVSWFLTFIAFVVVVGFAEFLFFQAGFVGGILWSIVGMPVVLWLFGCVVQMQGGNVEDSVLAIPVLGAIYNRVFDPPTYYKMDSALMFQEAVHNAVLEVIDELTREKGIRMLSETERKPINKAFASAA